MKININEVNKLKLNQSFEEIKHEAFGRRIYNATAFKSP